MKSYKVVNASTGRDIATYQYKVWAQSHARLIGGATVRKVIGAENQLETLDVDHWTKVFENRPNKYIHKSEVKAGNAKETLAEIKQRLAKEKKEAKCNSK